MALDRGLSPNPVLMRICKPVCWRVTDCTPLGAQLGSLLQRSPLGSILADPCVLDLTLGVDGFESGRTWEGTPCPGVG